jgi:hypothetical protein
VFLNLNVILDIYQIYVRKLFTMRLEDVISKRISAFLFISLSGEALAGLHPAGLSSNKPAGQAGSCVENYDLRFCPPLFEVSVALDFVFRCAPGVSGLFCGVDSFHTLQFGLNGKIVV